MTPINAPSLALRLKLSLLWLRHSYPFRWAHRPLCARFSDGILRFGSVQLCRSCLCVYGGLICCCLLCLFLDILRESALYVLLFLMVPAIALSIPQLYARWPRHLRDLLRFSMGSCIALCLTAALTANLLASVVGCLFYFATLTEIPILQALMEHGMASGPALALLLAGPALSLPSLLVIRSVIGVKKTAVFTVLVVVMATAAGMVFGFVHEGGMT